MESITERMVVLEESLKKQTDDYEDFQLMVMDGMKNINGDLSILRQNYEKSEAVHKKRFIIQTVILAIGIAAAIVLAIVF